MLEFATLSILSFIYGIITNFFVPTTIVGAIVGYIAYQQYTLAKNKFKLDLFDRRYKVYEASAKLFQIHREYNLGMKTDDDYKNAVSELDSRATDAAFLFSRKSIIGRQESLHAFLVSAVFNANKYIMYDVRLTKLIANLTRNIRSMDDRNQDSLTRLVKVYGDYLNVSQKEIENMFYEMQIQENDAYIYTKYLDIKKLIGLIRIRFIVYINVKCFNHLNMQTFPMSKPTKTVFCLIGAATLVCVWIMVG